VLGFVIVNCAPETELTKAVLGINEPDDGSYNFIVRVSVELLIEYPI
jgi:hypothetical protein